MTSASTAAPFEVLIVDDSAVIRRFITDVLASVEDLAVVGSAANGQLALERLERHLPDVVVLDVEMPVLDGLATLAKLRPLYPDLPVVMFSTLTKRGATATLDALALGATDYVLKPSQLQDMAAARQALLKELAPVVRTCAKVGRARRAARRAAAAAPSRPAPTRTPASPAPPPRAASGPARTPEVLVIGSSTGGPYALTDLVPRLPANFPVPVLLVQHMPQLFTKLLAERLDARSPLRVVEAESGMPVVAGTVYIAPGGQHLVVRQSGTNVVTALDDGPPENSCKPAVDVLFRSAVRVWGAHTLAAVLTGMGHDGLAACQLVREAGGSVVVQDEASSVVWGMPGAVARAGLADEVLPLADVAPALLRRVARANREVLV